MYSFFRQFVVLCPAFRFENITKMIIKLKPIRNVSNMIQSLNEIESLRSQLVKTQVAMSRKPQTQQQQQQQQEPGHPSTKKLTTASSDTHLVFVPPVDMASSSSSSSSSSSCQWTPIMNGPSVTTVIGDSGMESQRSEGTSVMPRPATKASSIPRPVFPSPVAGNGSAGTYTSMPSSSSSRSSPLVPHHQSRSIGNLAHSSSLNNSTIMSDEHVYSGYSREELVQLLKQFGSENVIIKRQLGSKSLSTELFS